MMISAWVDTILGWLFVIVYSAERYNSADDTSPGSAPPKLDELTKGVKSRDLTTPVKYYLSLSAYLGCVSFLYAAIIWNRVLFDPWLSKHVDRWVLNLSPPLVAAAVLTVFLPKLLEAARVEGLLRRKCQELGRIPTAARSLASQFSVLTFTAPDPSSVPDFLGVQRAHRKHRDLQRLLVRVESLVASIRQWPTSASFRAFAALHQKTIEDLEARRQSLSGRASSYFADSTPQMPMDGVPLPRLIAEYHNTLEIEAKLLLNRVYDFAARAVLQSGMSEGARLRLVKTLGFRGVRAVAEDTWRIAALLAFLIMVFMLCALLIPETGIGLTTLHRASVKAAMITCIIMLALACAVLPKGMLSFTERTDDSRPIPFYILASVVAFAGGVLTSFCFKSVEYTVMKSLGKLPGVAGTLDPLHLTMIDLQQTCYWNLLASILCASCAWFCDAPLRPRWSQSTKTLGQAGSRQRVRDAAWNGAILAAGATLVLFILSISHSAAQQRAAAIVVEPPNPYAVVIVMFVVGLTVGAIVPTWFRDRGGAEGLFRRAEEHRVEGEHIVAADLIDRAIQLQRRRTPALLRRAGEVELLAASEAQDPLLKAAFNKSAGARFEEAKRALETELKHIRQDGQGAWLDLEAELSEKIGEIDDQIVSAAGAHLATRRVSADDGV